VLVAANREKLAVDLLQYQRHGKWLTARLMIEFGYDSCESLKVQASAGGEYMLHPQDALRTGYMRWKSLAVMVPLFIVRSP
jgi:hypothetical protein